MTTSEALSWFERANWWSIKRRSASLHIWDERAITRAKVSVRRQRTESLSNMIIRAAELAQQQHANAALLDQHPLAQAARLLRMPCGSYEIH